MSISVEEAIRILDPETSADAIAEIDIMLALTEINRLRKLMKPVQLLVM